LLKSESFDDEKKVLELSKMLKKKLHSKDFKSKHKRSLLDFTRERKLPFTKMMVIMMRKSVKSIQNVLHETQKEIAALWNKEMDTVTGSAYSQARQKLNHTAFVELYESVRDLFYRDGDYKRFKDFRLLAVDGSIVTLPESDDIKASFSSMQVKNQDTNFSKEVPQARASVLYDVCNHMVLDARLDDRSIDERTQAKAHLDHTCKDDLIIFDRGYPSYELLATVMTHHDADVLMRIRKNSFKEAACLFEKPLNKKDRDVIRTVKPGSKALKEKVHQAGLPMEISLRFIQVILDTGEIEVLVTTVLDKKRLLTPLFKELYHSRWGIETYYDIIKNRLNLENFTGLSALAVKQDFFTTIFISNYESVLITDINQELQSKDGRYPQKVNHAVAFNTIKNHCFDLFYSEKDTQTLLTEMEKLFFSNPTLVRNNRTAPRNNYEKTRHMRRALNHHKRKKKSVF
jgi:hypothetical protein